MNGRYLSLVDLLTQRAGEKPDALLYRFLINGDVDGPSVELTYRELDAEARAIGAWLQTQGAAGQRVILLYEQGLDFIKAFFGCLYAGAIAVPAFPPDAARPAKGLPRLLGIIADCEARFILTSSALGQMASVAPQLAAVTWLASDGVDRALAQQWREPEVGPESLAFLQYTSGSTGAPKGVMVTHGNLLANSEQIYLAMGHDSCFAMVSWMPFYHDMGLIGGIIHAPYAGGRALLMSPAAFIERPARWLEAITAFGATTSGGPNFAYELCLRRVSDDERARLDLSTWKVAFSGAERVQAVTLERFTERFAGVGLRSGSLYPCYGLAEATLLVTGSRPGAGAQMREVSVSALRAGHALESGPDVVADDAVQRVVSCGYPASGLEVAIVDPETGERRADGEIGEIWVRGDNVALGYWNRPQESAATFGARLADSGDGPYLRTGDLGLQSAAGIEVVGRIKDLIILRGRNYYPEDIEATVGSSHPGVRMGRAAAFSVDTFGDEESAVAVVEATRTKVADPDEVVRAVRASVAQEHGVELAAVTLIKPQTLGRTTSGKIQRQACRTAWLAGELAVVHEWRRPVPGRVGQVRVPAQRTVASAESAKMLVTVRELLQRTCSVATTQLDAGTSLPALGLDSLNLAELTTALSDRLGVPVPLEVAKDGPTLGALADRLVALSAPSAAAEPTYTGENFDLGNAVDATMQLPFAQRVGRVTELIENIGFERRYRREIASPTDREVVVRDAGSGATQKMLMFGSNSYLGLAGNPDVAQRVGQLLAEGAVGLGGAPLLSGYTQWHRELEQRLAELKGTEDALLFSSGYQANVGVVSACCRGRSLVIHDEYVHASFRDGLKLAGVATAAFRHNDTEQLEQHLARHAESGMDLFVGIESLYSMDGDVAPIDEMVELCERYGATLIMDEAHATGVLGATGSGGAERFGVKGRVPIITGTLSKALAGVGGFVCGSSALINYLRLVSRSYIFSTSMPPIVTAQALGGLEVMQREPERLRDLRENIAQAHAGFRRIGLVTGEVDPESPILALLTPPGMDIALAADRLQSMGIFVNTVEYPAVPLDQQRFRVSIMSSHTAQDIDDLVDCFATVWAECGNG